MEEATGFWILARITQHWGREVGGGAMGVQIQVRRKPRGQHISHSSPSLPLSQPHSGLGSLL